MKKIKILTIATICLLFSLAAYAAPLTPSDMTGRKGKMIYGNVKSVKYGSGIEYRFNSNGDEIQHTYLNGEIEYKKYYSQTRYNDGENTYAITWTDNERIETLDKDKYSYSKYVFNHHGRVILYSGQVDIESYISVKYIYKKETDKLPSQTITKHHRTNETIEYNQQISYSSIDKQGNWTKCKVNETATTKYKDTKKKSVVKKNNFSQTAVLTYYTDKEMAAGDRASYINEPIQPREYSSMTVLLTILVGGGTCLAYYSLIKPT